MGYPVKGDCEIYGTVTSCGDPIIPLLYIYEIFVGFIPWLGTGGGMEDERELIFKGGNGFGCVALFSG